MLRTTGNVVVDIGDNQGEQRAALENKELKRLYSKFEVIKKQATPLVLIAGAWQLRELTDLPIGYVFKNALSSSLITLVACCNSPLLATIYTVITGSIFGYSLIDSILEGAMIGVANAAILWGSQSKIKASITGFAAVTLTAAAVGLAENQDYDTVALKGIAFGIAGSMILPLFTLMNDKSNIPILAGIWAATAFPNSPLKIVYIASTTYLAKQYNHLVFGNDLKEVSITKNDLIELSKEAWRSICGITTKLTNTNSDQSRGG